MMKNFSIDGQTAMDLITVGFQKGGDYSGELLDTLREYSPQFATMGMSADQMMGILIAGAQAGAWNLDKVGDAVKEFNIRAQDGSTLTAEGFAAIGLNANQMAQAISAGGEKGQQAFAATIAGLAAMKDPVQQNTAGVALFGTQWEDVRSKVIVAMADGVKGIGDFKGASEAAARSAYENNPGRELTKAMRELSDAFKPALEPLANIIKETVVPAIKEMADWFKNLSPEGQKAALAIAGIAAAIGPALIVIGSMASGFSSVVGMVTKVAGAVTTLVPKIASLVMGMGPIGLVIAGVVAAGILLYQNWDTIKDMAQELWKKISEVWEGIKSSISDAIEVVKTTVSKAWENIKTKTSEIWDSIKKFFAEWWPALLVIIMGPIGLIVAGIIKNWDEIKAKTSQIWDSIKSLLLNTINTIRENIAAIWFAISTNIQTTWDNIKTAVTTKAQDLKQNTITKLEEIWTYIKEIPGKALKWGADIISGLWEGIKNMAQTFRENFVGWIKQNIPQVVQSTLGIQSPSTVMKGYGNNMVEGLALGLEEKTQMIVQVMKDLLQTIVDKCKEILSTIGDLKKEVAQNPVVIPVQMAWPTETPGSIVPGDYGGGGGRGGGGGDGVPGTPGGIVPGDYETRVLDTNNDGGISVEEAGGWDNWDKIVANSVKGFAHGGIVTKPTMAMIGEAGQAEAVIPLPKLMPMLAGALQAALRLPEPSGGTVNNVQSSSFGDIIVNISNPGGINSDYDVDRLIDRIGKRLRPALRAYRAGY